MQRVQREREVQRDRSLGVVDRRGRPAGAPGEVPFEPGDVAERRRHQYELGLRQLDQRDLPGPTAVGVGVEVELVHHDLVDVGVGAVAQGDVREDLRGRADDRRLGVDAGVTGHHADVDRAEDVAEREELLRDQGLDRCRIERTAVAGQRDRVRTDGDQALAGAGRRRQDHVRPGRDLEQRLLLVRIEAQARRRRPRPRSRRRRRRHRDRPRAAVAVVVQSMSWPPHRAWPPDRSRHAGADTRGCARRAGPGCRKRPPGGANVRNLVTVAA